MTKCPAVELAAYKVDTLLVVETSTCLAGSLWTGKNADAIEGC